MSVWCSQVYAPGEGRAGQQQTQEQVWWPVAQVSSLNLVSYYIFQSLDPGHTTHTHTPRHTSEWTGWPSSTCILHTGSRLAELHLSHLNGFAMSMWPNKLWTHVFNCKESREDKKYPNSLNISCTIKEKQTLTNDKRKYFSYSEIGGYLKGSFSALCKGILS